MNNLIKCSLQEGGINGNNGKEVKKDIETDFGSGGVWYKDEQVAAFNFKTNACKPG